MRHVCLGVVASLVLALPARASDEDFSHEIARKHYELGARLYQASNYARALVEFRKSHELTRKPALLFNIARCHEVMGNLRAAIDNYRLYLDQSPQASHRAVVELRIRNISARMERQKTAAAESEEIMQPVAPNAPAGPPAGGEPVAEREETTVSAPADRAGHPVWKATSGWVAVGVGAALAATGVVFGALAKSKSDEYVEGVAQQRDYVVLDAIDASGERYQAVQIGTLVAGGLLAASGGALLLWHYLGSSREDTSVALSPLVGGGELGLGAQGRF